MTVQHEHGFKTTELRQKQLNNPRTVGTLNEPDSNSKPRLFLISNPECSGEIVKKNIRKKNIRNRKRVIYDNVVEFQGSEYEVNSKTSGLYSEIIIRMLSQLDIALKKWRRVFVFRFDLHSAYYAPDNQRISRFKDRLFKRLQRSYGFKKIGFCWVREQDRAEAQHYHWVLFLDGSLIRHSSIISEMVKECWEDETGAHHVPYIPHRYHFVDSKETLAKVIFRISYLAKARGKGYRDKQAKDFQCSRMKDEKVG